MKFAKVNDNTYLLRLMKGEEVVGSLRLFCQKQKISNASFSGLGSIENPTLAHYLVDTKKYTEKTLNGVFEVLSLLGNVAMFENKQLIHPHVSLSDKNMKGMGGHLVQGIVHATLEVVIQKFDTKFEKKFDEEIGLKLWNFPEELSWWVMYRT